jgi:hypothetical protein
MLPFSYWHSHRKTTTDRSKPRKGSTGEAGADETKKGNTMAEETKHSAGEIRFHDETVQLDRGVIQRTNFDWAGGVVDVSTSDYRWEHHQAQLTARVTTSMFVTKVVGDEDSVTITLADMRHRKLHIQINGSSLAEMLEMVMTDEDADDE